MEPSKPTCPVCAGTGTARYLSLPETAAGLYLLPNTDSAVLVPRILRGPCARCKPQEVHTWAEGQGVPLRDQQGFLLDMETS